MLKYIMRNFIRNLSENMKERNTSNGSHAGIKGWLLMYIAFAMPSLYLLNGLKIEHPLIFYLCIPLMIVFIVFIYELINGLKDKMHKCDYDYYRELPRDYSPSIVSYLMNFKTEFKKDVMADLLFLEQKGVLTIEDNTIKILETSVTFSEEHLNYLINTIITDGMLIEELLHVKKDLQETYIKSIQKDSVTLGLLEKHKQNPIIAFGLPSIFMCSIIFLGFASTKFNGNSDISLITKYIMLSIYLICIGSFVFMISYLLDESLVRTKQGKKDVGLWFSYTKFLRHFSIMKERNLGEKALWGYYFAYGLALGINKKVINKFKLENEKNMI